jgi:hypothetical protein
MRQQQKREKSCGEQAEGARIELREPFLEKGECRIYVL